MTVARLQPQPSLLPVVGMRAASRADADELLDRWAHPLGPCRRPFGRQDWLLEVDGEPIALATSASTVSRTVAGFARGQVVELARIARAPEHPGALRVALRLWRDHLAQRWPHWPVEAAVSYGMPGTKGDIYRFDGWERVAVIRPSGGSGTWTRARPAVNDIGDGKKTLWVWRYGVSHR